VPQRVKSLRLRRYAHFMYTYSHMRAYVFSLSRSRGSYSPYVLVMTTSARVETEERSNFPRERRLACMRMYMHACVRACVRAYVQRRMLDLGLCLPYDERNFFSPLGRIYIGHAVYEISASAIDSPRSRYAISLQRRDATRREKSRDDERG